jgi:hypothetical protein
MIRTAEERGRLSGSGNILHATASCALPSPETGTTRDFRSVREDLPGRIENANLSYNHAALDAWTGRARPC